jgi:hypothetical protein
MVYAEALEKAVLRELFVLFGNPAAVERAMKDATPICDKAEQYQKQVEDMTQRLKDVENSRQFILRMVAKGTVTEEQAERQLVTLKEDENIYTREKHSAMAALETMLTPEQVKQVAEGFTSAFKKANSKKKWLTEFKLNGDLPGMTFDDKRALLEMVFNGRTMDGKPMGVYVFPREGKKTNMQWSFRIVGRLIDLDSWTGGPIHDEEATGGTLQRRLLRESATIYAPTRHARSCYTALGLASEASPPITTAQGRTSHRVTSPFVT